MREPIDTMPARLRTNRKAIGSHVAYLLIVSAIAVPALAALLAD